MEYISAILAEEWACVQRQMMSQRKFLLKLHGVNEWKAWESANTRKGYWGVSNSPILRRSLDNLCRLE